MLTGEKSKKMTEYLHKCLLSESDKGELEKCLDSKDWGDDKEKDNILSVFAALHDEQNALHLSFLGDSLQNFKMLIDFLFSKGISSESVLTLVRGETEEGKTGFDLIGEKISHFDVFGETLEISIDSFVVWLFDIAKKYPSARVLNILRAKECESILGIPPCVITVTEAMLFLIDPTALEDSVASVQTRATKASLAKYSTMYKAASRAEKFVLSLDRHLDVIATHALLDCKMKQLWVDMCESPRSDSYSIPDVGLKSIAAVLDYCSKCKAGDVKGYTLWKFVTAVINWKPVGEEVFGRTQQCVPL
jgi:hypothetical protein